MDVNVNYVLGLFLGLLVGFGGVALVYTLVYRKHGKPVYDERQTLAQNKAFKGAFCTLAVYTVAGSLCIDMCKELFERTMVFALLGLLLSVTVYAVLCIIGDAYVALNKNTRAYVLLFAGLFLVTASACGIRWATGEPPIKDGVIGVMSLMLASALMALTVCVSLLVHSARQARITDDGEDGE